tara:strand:+ start:351 stop:686 length:336 start_codon:yes stop_codon:yes gene_type:complete
MNKFIKINGGADSAYMAPMANLLSFHCDTNAKLSVTFKSSLPLNLTTIGTTAAAATKAYDEIIFSITADKQMEVLDALVKAINSKTARGVVEIGTALDNVTAVDSITLGVS